MLAGIAIDIGSGGVLVAAAPNGLVQVVAGIGLSVGTTLVALALLRHRWNSELNAAERRAAAATGNGIDIDIAARDGDGPAALAG